MTTAGSGFQNPQPQSGGAAGRVTTILLSAVIAVAVIGYFVGINDGAPQPDRVDESALIKPEMASRIEENPKLVPAVRYRQVPETPMGPTKSWAAQPAVLPEREPSDLFAEFVPSDAEKQQSSEIRASRRAYNGAPPIIPHAVQDTSDAACFSCHGGGVQLAGMKASVMSHSYLANCTQCHAPPPPEPLASAATEVETEFVGLPAPSKGKRAYQGAPPTIPHSQWMRENCLACHGRESGWSGMETTHPWRSNCTQCHAPSAALDQAVAVDAIPMLPPLQQEDN